MSCPLALILFSNAARLAASVGGVRNVTPTHAAVVTPITIRRRCHASSGGMPRCGYTSWRNTATTNDTAMAVISLQALMRIQNHLSR